MTVFFFLTKVSGPFQGGRVEDNDDMSLFRCERSFLYSTGHTKQKMLVCSFALHKNNRNPIWGGDSFRMGNKKGRRGEFGVWIVCVPRPHFGFGVRFLLLLLLLFFTVFEKRRQCMVGAMEAEIVGSGSGVGGGYSFVDYHVSVCLFLLLSSFVHFFVSFFSFLIYLFLPCVLMVLLGFGCHIWFVNSVSVLKI